MTIHDLEKIVIDALQAGKPLSISDFGCIENLYKHIDIVAKSKFVPEFLSIIVPEIENTERRKREDAIEFILVCIDKCNDELVIQDVLKSIDEISDQLPELSELYFNTLVKQTDNKDKVPLVRAWVLEAAFRLSLKKESRRFKLLSYLIEVTPDDNEVYLLHACKVIGQAYAIWQEKELLKKLEEIKDAEQGGNEVWFELGMCYLHEALSSDTKESANLFFSKARDHYHQSFQIGNDRPDAEAYDAILSILLSTQYDQSEISPQSFIEKANRAVTIFDAWHLNRTPNVSWLNARNTELTNWYTLIIKLEKLLEYLHEPSWFDPKTVIENYLLNIYTASRTILKRNSTGGLEQIIQPRIESSLLQNKSQLYLLDKWLKLRDESQLSEQAIALRNKINLKKKDTTINIIDSLASIESLPKKEKTSFQQFVADYRNQQTSGVSLVIEEVFEKITSALHMNKSYQNDEVRKYFNIVLFNSLRFLESRMNASRQNYPNLSYLFEQDSKPKEIELQNDFHQFMINNLIDGNISTERSDIASGRVDVYFSFGRFNITSEIKRDWKDCSFKAIRENYLGQSAEYSNTDAKLGFLVVLDLLPKSKGMRSLESSVKVESIKKENEAEERSIVVMIVPGMRKTPSQVKL